MNHLRSVQHCRWNSSIIEWINEREDLWVFWCQILILILSDRHFLLVPAQRLLTKLYNYRFSRFLRVSVHSGLRHIVHYKILKFITIQFSIVLFIWICLSFKRLQPNDHNNTINHALQTTFIITFCLNVGEHEDENEYVCASLNEFYLRNGYWSQVNLWNLCQYVLNIYSVVAWLFTHFSMFELVSHFFQCFFSSSSHFQ